MRPILRKSSLPHPRNPVYLISGIPRSLRESKDSHPIAQLVTSTPNPGQRQSFHNERSRDSFRKCKDNRVFEERKYDEFQSRVHSVYQYHPQHLGFLHCAHQRALVFPEF